MTLPSRLGGANRPLLIKTGTITAVAIAGSFAVCATFAMTNPGGVPLFAWIASLVMPVLIAGPLTYYLLSQQLKLRIAYAKLHLLASTDALTDCMSRGAFTREVSARLLSLENLAPKDSDALLMIDADDFKRINDTFGHDQGDEALRAIAEAIRTNVRAGDLVGRIGGEEFGAYLANADLATTTQIAESIRKAISQLTFSPDGTQHKLSVSIGGAVVSRPAEFGSVYKLADEKLYAAKHAGRDRVDVLRAA